MILTKASTWIRGWWSVPHGANAGDDSEPRWRRYHRPGWLSRWLDPFIPGRVSRIHLYEAQERYLLLDRMLRYHDHSARPETPEGGTAASIGAAVATEAAQILEDARWLLTRRQHDLNFLWRDLCRVHIMIVEHLLPERLLSSQLDFCREEARRLGVAEDPVIKDMVERLAEATPDEQSVQQGKNRMTRAVRALIERFTTIRTDRIHQQFVNIRTYQRALAVLVVLSIILIANVDLVVRPPTGVAEGEVTATSLPPAVAACGPNLLDCALLLPAWFHRHLEHNLLLFVFIAGLTGGFLSVVIRLRDRDLVPGEDAYFLWYVLTKPFVGALGAIVLFILLRAGLLDVHVAPELWQQVAKETRPGAALFGFSFLAGFSERIVFPQFR